MKNYDPTKLLKCIEYLDKNNLYDWAMSGYLPYGGFKWLKMLIDVNSISENSSIGYIVEVDWEHPHELHILLAILLTCCQIIVKKLLMTME